MIPPYQQRGEPISPSAFNMLVDLARSCVLTSVKGGTFQRSVSGTNINVLPESANATANNLANCPFRVSNASVTQENGVVTLKVQVRQDPVLGTITEDYPNGRYPDGMSSDVNAPPFIIELQQFEGWEGIYLNLVVNQLNEIEYYPTAITISAEHEPKQGTSTYQRFLLASVFKKIDDNEKLYISEIANTCPAVYQKALPTCPFLVEDDSTSEDARISIRSGLVANTLPDGMTLADTYRMVISDTQDWWVIYIGMVVSNGVIQTTPGSITIFASDSYKTNTPTYVYFKIAEIQAYYNIDGIRYIGWILNSCAIPFIAGGGSTKCWFQCVDASVGTDLKVKVAQDQIAGRYPDGMGLNFPDYILEISQSCYIYAKILFNTTTLEIESGSTSITLLQSSTLQENTASEQYILISAISVGGDPNAITQINNVCERPIPNPCSLAWSD